MRLHQHIAAAVLAAASLSAHAELIYGVTDQATQSLIRFDSATPAAFTTVAAITGIAQGQTLRGIDFRPADGNLYAVATAAPTVAQLYIIDLLTGAASAVGGGFTLTGNTSTRVSLDFNPVVDRLRVVTGSTQNYRVNPITGALVAQDTDISGNPLISGIAYTNNVAGATQTTLYAYDFIADNLGTIGGINGVPSPNGGLFTIVGNSGVVTGSAALGFDISGATGIAYIAVDDFNNSPGISSEFFTVNLLTGLLTQVGADDLFPLLDISVLPVVPPALVPEPGMLGLMLGGLGLLAGVGRARRKVAQPSV